MLSWVRVAEHSEGESRTAMRSLDRITFDSCIMAGQACVRGMRIPVSLVVNLVANGMASAEILREYPSLEPDDIRQALKYAAWLAEDESALLSAADAH